LFSNSSRLATGIRSGIIGTITEIRYSVGPRLRGVGWLQREPPDFYQTNREFSGIAETFLKNLFLVGLLWI